MLQATLISSLLFIKSKISEAKKIFKFYYFIFLKIIVKVISLAWKNPYGMLLPKIMILVIQFQKVLMRED